MKKLIDIGSLAAIAIALILIGYSLMPQRPAQAAGARDRFSAFPVGQARLINLGTRREALEDLSPREQLDQMRDWLLFAVASSAGLTTADLNQALFDLPPIRHGYMQPVANFEYGDTRSCNIGNGQIIALVPADTSDERNERLARVVDEQRKNLGEKPTQLIVFEYDLKPADDPAQQTAILTRRDSVNAKDLFTSSAGYYEARINSLEDLKRLMGQVDDLTYANTNDGLTVGGRKIKGHNYRGIRVEEVATLYQSEAKIRDSTDGLKKKIDDFKSHWSNRTYLTEAEKAKFVLEASALKEELREARRQRGFVNSSGFSLDPTYDYAALAAQFDSTIARDIRNILTGQVPADAGDTTATADPFELQGAADSPSAVEEQINRAREGLAQKNSDPLFDLLGKIADKGRRGAIVARRIESTIDDDYGYQAARYDGHLKGTETGMVLFYTDLLAKLWAINYRNSAPGRGVDEFRPMTALPVSSVYEREMEELTNTRLWFGPQDKGYQVADKGQSMLFARTATRVYAASSNSLKPGVEVDPNAESAAFLGWWDNHYEEIARFEPEYERLNEIMKWSLVVAWLNQQNQSGHLGFLQSVPVERSNWFPDWVKQRDLRYTAWDQIGFYQRDSNSTTTETLPQLKSEPYRQFGKSMQLSGGVSLADEERFAKRVALFAESKVVPAARRSNLNYAPGESTSTVLKTFEGTSFQLSNPSATEAVTTATARQTATLRGLYGEVANEPVQRTVTQVDGGLKIGARLGDVPSGDLLIGNSENGFRVGWASRDADTALALGRRLSISRAPNKMLALDPNVEEAITLPGNGGYLIKLQGSQRWLKISPEGTSSTLESGYAARVGDFDAHAQNYNLAWVKPEEVSVAVREGIALRVQKAPNTAVIEQVRTGDYRRAVRELVGAPDQFKSQLDSYLSTAVAYCKQLMINEEYGIASRQLDDLIQIYGSREDLRLLKVVSQLNVPPSTRNAISELATQGSRPTLLDELSARLNDRLGLSQKGEGIGVIVQGDDLAVRYDLPGLSGSGPVSGGDLNEAKALIYVEDTPGLNNLDWQVAPGRTLDAAISGKFKARVIKLPRGDVASLRPAIIYDRAEGIKFNAISIGGTGGGFRQPRYFIDSGNPRGSGAGGGNGPRFLPRLYTPFTVPCVDNDNNLSRNDDGCYKEDKDTVIIIVRR